MMIDKLHIFRATRGPDEADSKLIIHADRPLSFPISAQSVKLVSRRRAKIGKRGRCVEPGQFAPRRVEQVRREPFRSATLANRFGTSSLPASNHRPSPATVARRATVCKYM